MYGKRLDFAGMVVDSRQIQLRQVANDGNQEKDNKLVLQFRLLLPIMTTYPLHWSASDGLYRMLPCYGIPAF